MRKETVFTVADLRLVSITCQNCATEVILDMAAFQPPFLSTRVGERMAFAPRQCPACKVPYDTSVTALNELQQAYASLSKLEGVISFRTPVTS